MQSQVEHSRQLLRSLAFLSLAVGVWGFFTSHATLSVDPPARYLEAKAMVDTGGLAITPIPGEPLPPGIFPGRDGRLYSYFGKGQSFIFAGPYFVCSRVLGIHSDKLIRSIIALTVFPLFLVLIALTFYGLLREFDFSPRACLAGATLVIFATGIWQTSKEGQEAVHLAFFYTLCAYALRCYQKTARLTWLTIAFVAIAGAFLTRTDSFPTVLCFGAAAGWFIWQHTRSRREHAARYVMASLAIVIGCGLPALVFVLGINTYLFGHPVSPIEGQLSAFSLGALPTGLRGLLISPGRGLLWYNPFVLLTLLGLPYAWRRHRVWLFFLFGSFLGGLLLHASYPWFHGNCCWGPRYLVRHLPFLFLIACFAGLQRGTMRRFQQHMFLLIIAASVLVQVTAVSLHHNRELLEMDAAYPGTWSERMWTFCEPEANMLPSRLANLRDAVRDMATGNILPWPQTPDHELPIEEQLQAPTLHYLAFWPFHLTYYVSSVRDDMNIPLWVSTFIFLGGFLAGVICWRLAWRAADVAPEANTFIAANRSETGLEPAGNTNFVNLPPI